MKQAKPKSRHGVLNTVNLMLLLAAAPAYADESVPFNIPAQSLTGALTQFSLTTHLQVLYEGTLADKVQAPALNGLYTPEQALQKLIAHSGLKYRYSNAKTITLEKAKAEMPAKPGKTGQDSETALHGGGATLPAVTVVGKAEHNVNAPDNTDYKISNAVTATKTDTPLMQTPLSVKVVSQQVLKDQQVVRLDQALRNVSGVVNGSGGDRQFFLRGFDLYNYYRDGYPFQNQWYHTEDLTNVERVEVLKGPGSILYGRSEPGGIVNFVTKQPQDTPYYSLRQQFGSYDWYRTNIDATGPLTDDKSLAYRFNLGYQSNNTFQEFGGGERIMVAPSIRWNLTDQTTTTAKIEYSDIKKTGEGNIPLLGNRPAPQPRAQNLGDPWNLQEDEYFLLSLNTEHAFNKDWTLRHRFNFSNAVQTLSGQSVNGTWDPVKANGDVGRFFFAQNLDGNDYLTNFYNALELTGKFETGFAKHTLLVGGDYLRSDVRSTSTGFGPDTADITNIYRPRHLAGPPQYKLSDVFESQWSLPWFGLYAQDQIELPYHVHVLAGLRYDNAETYAANINNSTGLKGATQYDVNDRVSPRGGVLWQAVPELSLYGSYTENFGQSNTFSQGLATPVKPQTAQQWETGAKTELFDGRFTASLAYFDLKKQNIAVTERPGVISTVGEAESRGIEFDFSGEILPGWNVIGAYAYTPFAKTLKDNFGSGTEGKRLHNAPRNNGSLWTTYEFQNKELHGLKIGAGVQALSQRQIGYNETAQAPGYATVNLMVSQLWTVGKSRVTAQVNLDNLLDKTYIDNIYSYGPTHYAAPRTVLGSIKIQY